MRLLLVFIGACFFSCHESYKDFNQLDENVHFKLISFVEQQSSISASDYLEINYAYCENELCEIDDQLLIAYTAVNKKTSFWKKFNLSDQMILVLDSNPSDYWMDLFDLSNKKVFWPVILKLKITDLINSSGQTSVELNEGLYEFREKCEIERMISDSMSNYLKKGECYVDVINEGNGDSVLNGCTVSLSYKAYFSDGRKFDDTDDWKDSIDIVYGQPLQLIVGLESGIHGLREGSEAKIIIPSHLAFGKHGSSSGIVPPYEPLLYNVKIISVKQPSL